MPLADIRGELALQTAGRARAMCSHAQPAPGRTVLPCPALRVGLDDRAAEVEKETAMPSVEAAIGRHRGGAPRRPLMKFRWWRSGNCALL